MGPLRILLEWSARHGGTLRDGEAALAAVRPEDVRVGPDAGPAGSGLAENCSRGTLRGMSHLGDTIQYVVVSDVGPDLIARAPRGAVAGLTVGSPVTCTWTGDAVRVFGAAQAHLVTPTSARQPEPAPA